VFRIRISSNADPDPNPNSDPGFETKIKKISAGKTDFLKIKLNLLLSLEKGRPSYRRILQPSKESIQHFST
jgi:hypothetical protein